MRHNRRGSRPSASAPDRPAVDHWQSLIDRNRPRWLCTADVLDAVVPRLLVILGPDAVSLTAVEFCATSHCPPDKLDEWLRTEWVRHNVSAIASLTETAGPFPLVLIRRGTSKRAVIEVWSVPPDAADLQDLPAPSPASPLQ